MGALVLALIIGGSKLIGSLIKSAQTKKAAETQAAAAQAGIDTVTAQQTQMEELFKPYTQAGTGALAAQEAISGLRGPEAQKAAIEQLEQSPELKAMIGQGENALLQNASATGGLRGGNIQAALAQFRPAALAEIINRQYGRLGGLTQIGATAAGQQAGLGQASAATIASLLGLKGGAIAGGQVAQGNIWGNFASELVPSMMGAYSGAGGTGMSGLGAPTGAPSFGGVGGGGGAGLQFATG